MTSEKGCRKDKNQNIQVFVRLRPLNQRERDIKSLGVIEVLHNREVVVRQSHTKKFTFDRAFGPNAKQVEVYQDVVSPLIEEVLNGYNCTVFAYGQTGTGKTHTMVGENTTDDSNWQNDPLAGIIPRALSQLFDELRISNTEHTVRVSYLELYNEELFDLLSTTEDNSKLRIYEDVTRKGSNIVNGLEEITVSNKNEVYKIMAQGQERKRVASTLMNAQSSRSHTVFTIVVHMKENSPEGEELVKIGKLNLVDLAGSENISKAGSDNPAKKERARECVNINQSLLTLGRVITALVEKHPHIPYRESKLTRILQESLGGRTKTSIIATISPGHKDLEETMSTLEYANRAKNIQNKPEVNQKMTKKAILRQYAEEIDRLKKDLQAAREKNGVFLSNDTYTELTLKQEEQRKEIQELLLKKRAMEEEKDKMETVFSDLHHTLETRAQELQAAKTKLSDTRTKLVNTSNLLRSSQLESEERAHLVERHAATESALGLQARQLLAAADTAASHAQRLRDTVDRRRNVESSNLQVTHGYREQAAATRAQLSHAHAAFARGLADHVAALHDHMENLSSSSIDALQSNKTVLDQLVQNITQMMDELKSVGLESEKVLSTATESHSAMTRSCVERRQAALEAALTALLAAAATCLRAAQERDLPRTVADFVNQWHTQARERIECLRRTHAQFRSELSARETTRAEHARAHAATRRGHAGARVRDILQACELLEEERTEMYSRLDRELESLAAERRHTEARLEDWVVEETRRFQERLRQHVDTETRALEDRLSQKSREIEEERSRVEARVSRHLLSYRALLAAAESETQHAGLEDTERDGDSGASDAVVASYSKEFDDGSAAITFEMEALSGNVVEVARHLYSELLSTLAAAHEQLQNDTQSVAKEERVSSEQFLARTEEARVKLLHDHREAVHTMLARVQANNTSTISSLSTLSSTEESIASGARHHAAAHAATVEEVTSLAASFEEQLTESVDTQAQIEDKYLAEEYKVYSPTGGTPQRTEYRYPRVLAATSPHERILARFRAQRRASRDDDDCILIESEPESRTSDAESSVSDDSVFVAPSSPRGPRENPPLIKCTSESDIYNIRRNQESQGKENSNNSMTNGYKKPSKLRAPSSHKKPLVERNGLN